MSRPRKPFGPNPPGRLAATMIRVLAAEMSDAARLTRGKRYWTDDAVIDLVVGHGAVTAEVQGSRATPYVVTLETRPGRDVPSRRDVTVWCTCPDHDLTGRTTCKHAVAALFALSDEVAVDPDVLARWRRTDQLPSGPSSSEEPSAAETDPAEERRTAEPNDVLADVLGRSDGPALPPLPVLSDLVHPRPAPRPLDLLVADVLDDALRHLHIRWD
jgi:uncharacterized Zn finger protein